MGAVLYNSTYSSDMVIRLILLLALFNFAAMQDGSPQSNTVGQSGESRSIEDYNTEETEGVYQKDERHNLNANCLPTPKQCKNQLGQCCQLIFRVLCPDNCSE